MTTITITLDNIKEANLLIEVAKKLLSVKSIKAGKRTTVAKGEPMDLKEFRAMIQKSEKSGFISVEQLEANMKKW
jgi:hypothetical protein